MNIREMSFMKGISKVWDLARNVSGFNTTQINAPTDLNVSVGSLIGDLPDLPDITLTFSPKVHPNEASRIASCPPSPVFLTPPSNIPVSRIKTLEFDSQITLDAISPIRADLKNSVRSKSECSYRQDPYFIPTPSALFKQRLKEKVSLEGLEFVMGHRVSEKDMILNHRSLYHPLQNPRSYTFHFLKVRLDAQD